MKNVLKHIFTLVSVCLVASFASCLKDDEPKVYYTEFVTTHITPDQNLYFEQVLRNDLGSYMLYPATAIAGSEASQGRRVLLQYSVDEVNPDNSKKITVADVYTVRYDTIISAHPDTIAAYPNDPLKINTIFRTGDYINLDMSIEYFNQAHSLDLFRNPMQASSDTIDVILRHDRNNDVYGYWTSAFASFYIPDLAQYSAMRVYANVPNTPEGYFVIAIKD